MDTSTPEAQAPTEPTDSTSAPAETQTLDPQAQHDQLANLLSNPEWTPEGSEEPVTEVAEQTPAGEQPQEASQATTDDDDDTKTAGEEDLSKRFRFTDPADRKFATLRKADVPPDEAARIAYGITKAPVAESEQPAGTETAASNALTQWQEQLADVDAQLAESGASEGLMNADILALMQKRGELLAEITTEQRFQEREAQAQAVEGKKKAAAVTVSHRETKVAAVKRFPSIAQPGSEVQKEADRLTGLYGNSEMMSDPSAPMQIAEQAAMNVARAKAVANGTTLAVEFAKLEAQAQAQAANPAQKVAVTRKIIPASGAQGTLRPDQPASEEDKYKEASSISDPRAQKEALDRLLYGPP